MCGIVGAASISRDGIIDSNVVAKMTTLQFHRGPDNTQVYFEKSVALGHNRLSIIDLADGAQPMSNEDGTIWITFNGEIFNYIELRETLKHLGHFFRTKSDTEVIVHAYEQYGDNFVKHLNGQFAFGLWDSRHHRLLLVRDRVGIHPLFYTIQEGQLIFASEIKAIQTALKNPLKLSIQALDQVFTFWTTQSPLTMFENIFEVRPGCMMILENERLREKQYWDWSFPEDGDYLPGTDEELSDQLLELLSDSTKIRLRSDVPVGAYLSGGLDSSALVSLILSNTTHPLKTFSLSFEDGSLDETVYQRQVVDSLGVKDHRRILCQNQDIASSFPQTVYCAETTLLRAGPAPMRLLSGLVRNYGYKVVLTGEGADEVLGGYDIFKEAKIRQFWAKQPESEWRPNLLKKLYPYLDTGDKSKTYLNNFYGMGLLEPNHRAFSHLTRWQNTAQCKMFFSDDTAATLRSDASSQMIDSLPAGFDRWHPFNRAQYLEAKTLLRGYLLSSQGDRMLMANSVEGRFPFLDHRVIEFANKLHPKMKMRGLNEKFLLKKAMKNRLPASILNRTKQPYRAPDSPVFFTGKPLKYVEEAFSPEALDRSGYFDAKRVALLVNKAKRGAVTSNRDNMALVGILSTQLLHSQFIENNP
jgi:asparagine synthase (glutamine-hydrolysing)